MRGRAAETAGVGLCGRPAGVLDDPDVFVGSSGSTRQLSDYDMLVVRAPTQAAILEFSPASPAGAGRRWCRATGWCMRCTKG